MRPDLVDWLKRESREEDFVRFLAEGLVRLCSIDTTPHGTVSEMATREAAVFSALSSMLPGCEIAIRPIRPDIVSSPSYTEPYYTTDPEPYARRGNLLAFSRHGPRAGGRCVALNAHIDTVAPFFPPRRGGDRVRGRGAVDDKGGCMAIVGALRLLDAARERFDRGARKGAVAMFVIDEESGGNGSLSLALDRELRKAYDALFVIEASNGEIHPANRGALWYKVKIPRTAGAGKRSGSAAVAFEIVRSLELEGRAIWEESIHPLFPDRPVQTCHGVLGPYGEHPSRVCAHVRLSLSSSLATPALRRALERGLSAYVERYGDKTKETDPATGRPKVDHHYDLRDPASLEEGEQRTLDVWGCAGHMGAVRELDGAITKAAFFIEALETADPAVDISLDGGAARDGLVLEGGQGFLPTHTIDGVGARLAEAVDRAWRQRTLLGYDGPRPVFSTDKLHNDAFERSPRGPAVVAALRAAKKLGLRVRKPLRGFPVSCDARIFAQHYPELEVVTTGPGRLGDAHSDNEQIDVRDIAETSALLALVVLQHRKVVAK